MKNFQERKFENIQPNQSFIQRIYSLFDMKYKVNSHFYIKYNIIPMKQVLNEPLYDKIEFIVDKNNFLYPIFYELPLSNIEIITIDSKVPKLSLPKTIEKIQEYDFLPVHYICTDIKSKIISSIEICVHNILDIVKLYLTQKYKMSKKEFELFLPKIKVSY